MESVQPQLETLVSVKVIHGSSGCADGSEDGGEPPRSSGAVENEEEIVKDEERRSNASVCSVEVDLELGLPEKVVHLAQSERDCRICHMSLDAANLESGVPIELGCSCKADLAAAHKHCAETWFKIKGNKICEVCGSIAGNVVGSVEVESEESRNEANGVENQTLRTSGPRLVEGRSFWQGHRFLTFLLACMVFAFVISWLFHFNVPST
ncbi:Zinc finger RING-CH-type [Arabidopsis suecica]|uniref:Zinc finger RING-CH-type n=1 Tax=Arabidopsis suecica TaxID=45249 RepID=A0A8T1Z8I4_ARASU|nr:Zinc finger RING-CH-type [Arabidopsis suecica]